MDHWSPSKAEFDMSGTVAVLLCVASCCGQGRLASSFLFFLLLLPSFLFFILLPPSFFLLLISFFSFLPSFLFFLLPSFSYSF
jgi:hypothetical protein